MKRLFPIVLLILMAFSVWSQDTVSFKSIPPGAKPKVFLGVSTGINNMDGLIGVHADVWLGRKFILETGAGLGSWGYKYTLNAQFHPKSFYNWFCKAGYSYSTGLEDFETELELANGDKKDVVMDLKPAGNINISAGKSWNIGRHLNRIYLEAGYSISLLNEAYSLEPGIELSSTSEAVMEFLKPGGLMIGFGVAFGL